MSRAHPLRAAAVALALAASASGARAQFPAELSGRVVEAGSARPIPGAVVEIGGGMRTLTDAAGAFALRHADAGLVEVSVAQTGYATTRLDARLEAGRTTVILIALEPAPIPIDALEVSVARDPGVVFTRADIQHSGARSLGDLLRGVPGVVVRDAADGGERISIRGSSADEVLVLLDGAPVNDPLTGEADAGALSLQAVSSVRVLAGAQSARFGARAAAGAVLVESMYAHEPYVAVEARAGSLGALGIEAEAGTHVGGVSASAGARHHRLDGEFEYELPDGLGGGSARRVNAAERELGGFVALALPLFGELRVRADGAHLERGLPGPMHATTPEATRELTRADAGLTWMRAAALADLTLVAHGTWQRIRFDDPAPAFGPAYHDTAHVRDALVRLEAEHRAGVDVARTLALGAETRLLELESTTLDRARVRRADPAVFARGSLESTSAFAPRAGAGVRLDRWNDDWLLSHELSLGASLGRVTAGIAHRSAFSPPAASDQFFAAGFAIAPNADLEPERVRSELELSLSTSLAPFGVPLDAGASAYRADVDGMIVWAPDFRFVWSPRNRDVKRRGAEAWLRARPLPGLELSAWAARARVTYDWPGEADTVQVVYRPRHSGGLALDWRPADWSLGVDALYTGIRYATPGHANPLPGYWDVRVALGRTWQAGRARVDALLRVDRLLDNTDAFVHGHAEPGRRISLELRLRAAARDQAVAYNPNRS